MLYVPCVGEGKLKVDQKWHIWPLSAMPGGRQQIMFTFLDIIKTCGRHRKWKGPNILHHSLVGVCPLFVNWKCFNLLLVQKPVFFILTPPLTSYVVFCSNTDNCKTVNNTLSVICRRRKSELGVGSNLQQAIFERQFQHLHSLRQYHKPCHNLRYALILCNMLTQVKPPSTGQQRLPAHICQNMRVTLDK